jgi:hypothetical protein
MADLSTAIVTEAAARDIGGEDAGETGAAAFSGNVLAHHGCDRLHTLLKGLAVMFPEKAELATWIIIFENTILSNPEMESMVIHRWHTEMTETAEGTKREPSLYVKTRERDIESLLNSGVWVLEEIDARTMYNDPDIDDADREAICQHIDKINACAEAISAVPEDMMQSIMSCVSTLDPTQPITAETTFAMLQKIIGCKPEDLAHNTDAMERLIGWSQHLIEGMNNGGLAALQTIAGEASLASGTGLPDLASISALMQSELMGCNSILSTSEDSLDISKVSALASMFASGFSSK